MIKNVPQFIWNLFKYHEKALIFKPWGSYKTNIAGFYGQMKPKTTTMRG